MLPRTVAEIHDAAKRRAERLRLTAHEAMQLRRRVVELAKLREEITALITELAGISGVRPGGEPEPSLTGGGAALDPAEARHATYEGDVNVQVGPLRDFAQLTGFEDAATRIAHAEDVSIHDFSDGRATFSMRFAQPVALVRELEQRTPFGFSVRAASGDAVVLDVRDSSTEAA
jgi:hypothetical protein